MARAIDGTKATKEVMEYSRKLHEAGNVDAAGYVMWAASIVDKQPTIDPLRNGYVLLSVHEQVQWERDIAIDQLHSYGVEFGEKADVQRVRHGKWLLKAYKEPSNYEWNVKAECSECCDEEKEIWAGFFPNVPDWLARDVAIQYAEEVKMSNYCPNCGARMDGE